MPFGAYEDKRVVGIIARAARAAEQIEVSCEAQQGQSGVKRKLFKSCRNNMVVKAWSRKGGVKSRRVCDICRTFQAKVSKKMLVAEIRESKMIGLELEQETTKKYLADTNLHVHLKEIKVDKTLCFVEEPIEIIDREVKSLKRSRIPIVKSIGTRSEVMRIS
uniref:Putative reverse transcriptase domain-containing protein n=1 Tax=Tanacetum cinerariifolium TaxID=118510 RepID=A0A699H214_TANCI|nr:putative reverse transcriptase domain-containing protein [Tanacetum cinerariifolium]